jgi:hypothetical protein
MVFGEKTVLLLSLVARSAKCWNDAKMTGDGSGGFKAGLDLFHWSPLVMAAPPSLLPTMGKMHKAWGKNSNVWGSRSIQSAGSNPAFELLKLTENLSGGREGESENIDGAR